MCTEIQAKSIKHPAVWSKAVLLVIAPMLTNQKRILDPFAGTGALTEILQPSHEFVGIEIEPEWAGMNPLVQIGDARNIPYADLYFDCIVTSPTYANRMADHHEAKDKSHRRTYRHYLGRKLDPANSGGMQWGDEYRQLHVAAWKECMRVLSGDGIMILNCKDHIRSGVVQHVTQWHVETLVGLGVALERWQHVETGGYRYGANRARVPHESVLTFRKPGRGVAGNIRIYPTR